MHFQQLHFVLVIRFFQPLLKDGAKPTNSSVNIKTIFSLLQYFLISIYFFSLASKRLSDLIRRPWDLYRAGLLDEYFMGLMNQVAQAMDDSITQEVSLK